MLFSSISPALTENGVANAQISAQLIVESTDRRDAQMDGEEVQIYANDNNIVIDCNTTDHAIWLNTFKNQSLLSVVLLIRVATITSLLSSAYSNTQQRIILRDMVSTFGFPH